MKFDQTEETITLHGLGFLQIKLQGKQRLHVWHPDLPRRKCWEASNIHDHRFGFVSRVLIGSLTNTIYATESVPFDITQPRQMAQPTHIGYLHEGPRTEFGNRPWIPDLYLRVAVASVQTIRPSESYTMLPYVYHSSVPNGDGRVATIMQKMEECDRGAHSLCTMQVVPEVDFDRKQWPERKLWEVVCDVLGYVTTDQVRSKT